MGMKILLLALVLAVFAGWLFARSRRDRKGPPAAPPAPDKSSRARPPPLAVAMLACAHCQVHLPRDDAQFDTAGKPYCSAEHRVAGPR